MAVTGGFCPLPARLGGDALSGLTAEQHARLAADTVAKKRTAPFCVFSWSLASAGGNPVVTDYFGMNGAGATYAPNLNSSVSSTVRLRWKTAGFSDPYGIACGWLPRHAVVTASGSTFARGVWELVNDGIYIRLFDAAGSQIAAPIAGSAVIW
jgi:hypothetical protein